MIINSHKILLAVVMDVLSKYTLMFAENEVFDGRRALPEESVEVDITFRGFRKGSLNVVAPKNLCREFAANILGLDGDKITEDTAHPMPLALNQSVLCRARVRQFPPPH